MNEAKVRDIDMIRDDYNTLILECFVNGMPKPNVTWYKVCHLYFFKYNYFDFKYNYFEIKLNVW
jgi:hypothetical protein